ncbi:hypothetical protein DFH09DRAFT_1312546 [Mycena vulgaris]|nr:hypothetical protein DFH09DRAFT_1312546 [Mycena vulgaris]
MTFAKFAADCCSVCLSCCACFSMCQHTAVLRIFCPCIPREEDEDEEDDASVRMEERGQVTVKQPVRAPAMAGGIQDRT